MIRNLIAIILATFALSAFAAVDVNQADRAALETVKGVGPGNAVRFSQAGLTVGGATFDASTVAAAPAKPSKTAKAEK